MLGHERVSICIPGEVRGGHPKKHRLARSWAPSDSQGSWRGAGDWRGRGFGAARHKSPRRDRGRLSRTGGCCRTGRRSCAPWRSRPSACRHGMTDGNRMRRERCRCALRSSRPTAGVRPHGSRNAEYARSAAWPPGILLPGAWQSHEVKCLALGQAVRSVPHSATSLSARPGPMPWIWGRSTPSTPCSAARTSNAGAPAGLGRKRGLGDGVVLSERTLSSLTACFSLASQSAIFVDTRRRDPATAPARRCAPRGRCRPAPPGSSRGRHGTARPGRMPGCQDVRMSGCQDVRMSGSRSPATSATASRLNSSLNLLLLIMASLP
ncbi:hypothetical protein CLV79_107160 [Limimaricola soesokkakensis]|uniref:Uncharacterized protein n=1 Tax=Limimaricola soesokkakensis TaxID=1343159 RepID=A0A1X6ZL40_9RHOB|nr:hypothetical protein CLV79_107160 [Limimaricola soesokkakensis]SLN54957.1 hypothetical protein LOS8367_02580 [Limimaricola soesokkakensis]